MKRVGLRRHFPRTSHAVRSLLVLLLRRARDFERMPNHRKAAYFPIEQPWMHL